MATPPSPSLALAVRRRTDSSVLRDPKHPEGVVSQNHPQIWSPYTLYRTKSLEVPSHHFLGYRSYLPDGTRGQFVWSTYSETMSRISRTAAWLAARVPSSAEGRSCVVAFVARGGSREDFHVVLGACSLLGVKFAPLNDAAGPEALGRMLGHSGASLVWCCPERLGLLAEALAHGAFAEFKRDRPLVVAMDSRTPEPRALDEMERGERGKVWDVRQSQAESSADLKLVDGAEPAKAGEGCLVIYTSGTTGEPKGVVLSQTAAISGSVALVDRLPGNLKALPPSEIVYLSFLPLSHIYAICVETAVTRLGGCMGYYSGDPKKVVDDVAVLRPIAFAAVPRIYQRVYDGILQEVAKQNPVKRAAFWAAYKWKLAWLKTRYGCSCSSAADRIIFSAVKQRFGGRLLVMVSAGAPMPPHIGEFFRVVVCDTFLEGWGMTETGGLGMSRCEEDTVHFGHCGLPYCMCELKLRSLPDLGYYVDSNPPRGELLVSGPCCFSEYLHNEQLTRQVRDEDGWVHSGDVCELTRDGKLRVVDRVKSLFKLAQGEYVSPERVEQVLTQSKYIRDAFVWGLSTQVYPVAVVVPVREELLHWAEQHRNLPCDDFVVLCHSPQVMELMKSEVSSLASSRGLLGFERPHHLLVEPVPFEESQFVSASMKLKRDVIIAHYKASLVSLYGDPSP